MFKVSNDTSWKVIKPQENITAQNADGLRGLLLDLTENHNNKIRFDFSFVQDIDFVALGLFASFANMIKNMVYDFDIEIINADNDIVNLFQMMNLDKIYKIIE